MVFDSASYTLSTMTTEAPIEAYTGVTPLAEAGPDTYTNER